MFGPPLRRQRASPVPEVREVAAFGGSCIWWLMLLGDRGLSWCLGQRTDWNFSERLVLPRKMLLMELADVLHCGLGGPQARDAEDEGEPLLQTRDVAFYFLVPEAPECTSGQILLLATVTDPRPSFRGRGTEPPLVGIEPGQLRRASGWG